MTVPVHGNNPQGRYPQPPRRPKRGPIKVSWWWMLLLIAGALVLLPLALLAGIALTGSHHDPASTVAPVRVSNTEPATLTPVKPCYPFQLDCTPG